MPRTDTPASTLSHVLFHHQLALAARQLDALERALAFGNVDDIADRALIVGATLRNLNGTRSARGADATPRDEDCLAVLRWRGRLVTSARVDTFAGIGMDPGRATFAASIAVHAILMKVRAALDDIDHERPS